MVEDGRLGGWKVGILPEFTTFLARSFDAFVFAHALKTRENYCSLITFVNMVLIAISFFESARPLIAF